jgi:hypothetical protein
MAGFCARCKQKMLLHDSAAWNDSIRTAPKYSEIKEDCGEEFNSRFSGF